MGTGIRRRGRLAAALAASAALAAIPSSAAAVVSTGHSGWAWSSPSPQGEDIADLSFAGSTGYAVGGFGTLLRTSDGGQTWAGLPSGTSQGLTRVQAVGPAGLVAAGGCAVRRSEDAGASLTRIDVGGGDTGCGTSVRAVAFADPLNGLLAFDGAPGAGPMLSTTDGGKHLSRRTPVPAPVSDMVAVSPTTAFATAADAIYRTTDTASSWTRIAETPRDIPRVFPQALRALTFASANVAYAVGDAGTVMKSTDGGATWAGIPGPAGALPLNGVSCADENLCLFTTAIGNSIVRTPDGGATYAQVTPSGSPIRAVAFASPTRAIAAGAGGATVISDDGGLTWRGVGGSLGGTLATIVARAGGFGYGVGGNAIAVTADGGETFRTFGIPTPLPIHVAAFIDPDHGYAQDSGKTLWRTSDGGVSWQVLDPGPVTGLLRDIIPLNGNRVILVTRGGIAYSADGGDSFTLVKSPALRASRAIRNGVIRTVSAGSRAFVIGARGILRSLGGGVRWDVVSLPRANGRVARLAAGDCAGPATCWVVTTGGRLYRTTNAGRTWSNVTPGVGVPLKTIRQVAAGRAGEAFIAPAPSPAGPGLVLHTADGGKTWAPQLLQAVGLQSIDAVPGRAWALAFGGTRVLTTTTGGSVGTASVLSIKPTPRVARGRGDVTITGRLAGALGGEQVTLYATKLPTRTLTVSSSGTFTARYRLKRETTFVAQWAGDGVRDGDGTPALVVTRK
jgi:photosystem II stability/assembly factor-like uncharacterized protein